MVLGSSTLALCVEQGVGKDGPSRTMATRAHSAHVLASWQETLFDHLFSINTVPQEPSKHREIVHPHAGNVLLPLVPQQLLWV